MNIILGADHAGFAVKEQIRAQLEQEGHTVIDVGTHSEESCDYSDFAIPAAEEVVQREQAGESVRGVLLCGSGIGMSIAANKVKGARAALATNVYMAAQGVEHDGANILVLATRVNTLEEIREMVTAFLQAQMNEEEKYHRRLQKVMDYEQKQ